MKQEMHSTMKQVILTCISIVQIASYATVVGSQTVNGPQLVPDRGILLTQTQGLTDPAANCSVENVVSAELDWLALPISTSYTVLLSVALLQPLLPGVLLNAGGLTAALNKINGGKQKS